MDKNKTPQILSALIKVLKFTKSLKTLQTLTHKKLTEDKNTVVCQPTESINIVYRVHKMIQMCRK